jgi:hypothetical protein
VSGLGGITVTMLNRFGVNRRQENYAASLYDALIGGNIRPISEGQQKIAVDKKIRVFSVGETPDIRAYTDYRSRIPLRWSRKTY